MNWLMYVNWLAGPVLQITLLIFMARREFHRAFPRFFSYILFQTLKSACLFVVYRYFPESYFDAYWTGNAVSVIFTVAVMDEILRSLFSEYGGIQILGTTIFRWSCGPMSERTACRRLRKADPIVANTQSGHTKVAGTLADFGGRATWIYLSLPFTKSTDFSSASSAESSNASPLGRSGRFWPCGPRQKSW